MLQPRPPSTTLDHPRPHRLLATLLNNLQGRCQSMSAVGRLLIQDQIQRLLLGLGAWRHPSQGTNGHQEQRGHQAQARRHRSDSHRYSQPGCAQRLMQTVLTRQLANSIRPPFHSDLEFYQSHGLLASTTMLFTAFSSNYHPSKERSAPSRRCPTTSKPSSSFTSSSPHRSSQASKKWLKHSTLVHGVQAVFRYPTCVDLRSRDVRSEGVVVSSKNNTGL